MHIACEFQQHDKSSRMLFSISQRLNYLTQLLLSLLFMKYMYNQMLTYNQFPKKTSKS